MAHLGHEVTVIDTDTAKIQKLSQGIVPFHEPALSELLTETLASGRLKFTSEWNQVANDADVHFVCVGTPQKSDSGAADLSQVRSAVSSLAAHVTTGIVVGKSTVPVGTAAELADILGNVHLVWNPEFLREGFAVEDTLNPDRIVLGVRHASDADAVKDIYQATIATGTPVLVTDYATAELVKVAANAFLATKISFINAFADLADTVGADITTLADAIGHDTRIGRRFLNAGVGFGGGCLPKDIRALHARATELGVGEQFEFLAAIDAINESRRATVVERTVLALDGQLEHKNIAILGAAFKPDSDDIRDSPALHIAHELAEAGATVRVHDPVAISALRNNCDDLVLCDSVEEVLADADIVLHLTEWRDYREIDPELAATLVRSKVLIDGRNILDLASWSAAGWSVTYLGKPGS
jgi:UDPglucose 6-dehydrogenase